MPDEFDVISDNMLLESESLAIEARLRAAAIPKGAPGICHSCEIYSPRLVDNHCAPCRDSFNK